MNKTRALNQLLKVFGIKKIVNSNEIDELSFYRWLKKSGIPHGVIYDIGAHEGNFTRKIEHLFQKSKFYLFEANEAYLESLESTGHPYFISLLYSDAGLIKFFSVNGTGDSIYEENNLIKYKNVKPKYLQATTLDSLVLENNLLLPDIVKLDVQGAEIDVMRGGIKTLSNASIVTLEMPLVQYNKGAPTFDQYLYFMRELEFYPLKIVELHPILGVLVQIDISFIRKDYLSKIYGDHERRFLL